MRRIIDLTLTITGQMRGVRIETVNTIEADGWNATTLALYSHCGTHLDAPRHFLSHGATVEQLALDSCVGPALVLDLTPAEPRELITVERIGPWADRIGRGDRLLLRTDWSRRHGTPEYRDALPRIDRALARWLVQRGVVLVGVEPPSVADVNNLEEVTSVHHELLGGGVVIVEGLANLDQLSSDTVELIVLPLKVEHGDGSPVRAIAIEQVGGP